MSRIKKTEGLEVDQMTCDDEDDVDDDDVGNDHDNDDYVKGIKG